MTPIPWAPTPDISFTQEELYQQDTVVPLAPLVAVKIGDSVSVTHKGRGPFPGWVTNTRKINEGVATITFLWDRGMGVAVLSLPHLSALTRPGPTATYWV